MTGTLRPMVPGDAAAAAAIYAHHVRHGTGTFDEVPPGTAEMADRIAARAAAGHPQVVAEVGGILAGYAYAAPFHPRSGWRYTAEDSVYVHPDHGRAGHGAALLGRILDLSREAGFRQMMAVIGDSANAASIALHTRLGFRHMGVAQAVGVKFGRDLDVVYMQKSLAG